MISRRNKTEDELIEEYPDIEMKKELKGCTFKPDLNEETYRITQNQEGRNPFKSLYSQAKVLNKQREDLFKEKLEEKLQDEVDQCTFKPDIEPLKDVDVEVHVPDTGEKIEERALKYVQEKNKRIGRFLG